MNSFKTSRLILTGFFLASSFGCASAKCIAVIDKTPPLAVTRVLETNFESGYSELSFDLNEKGVAKNIVVRHASNKGIGNFSKKWVANSVFETPKNANCKRWNYRLKAKIK